MPQGVTSIGILSGAIHKLESNPMAGHLSGIMRSTSKPWRRVCPFPTAQPIANLWLFRKLFQNRLSAEPATNAAMRTTTATTNIRFRYQRESHPDPGQSRGQFQGASA